MEKFEELKARFERLPRHKQIISKETYEPSTKDYDLIFVATGFTEASKTHPLMTSIPEQDRQNVYIAGDAAPGSTKTVVQAQASGHKTAADIMTKLEATASKKQATTAKKSSYFGKLSSALYTQQEAPQTRNTPAEAHAAEARRR